MGFGGEEGYPFTQRTEKACKHFARKIKGELRRKKRTEK